MFPFQQQMSAEEAMEDDGVNLTTADGMGTEIEEAMEDDGVNLTTADGMGTEITADDSMAGKIEAPVKIENAQNEATATSPCLTVTGPLEELLQTEEIHCQRIARAEECSATIVEYLKSEDFSTQSDTERSNSIDILYGLKKMTFSKEVHSEYFKAVRIYVLYGGDLNLEKLIAAYKRFAIKEADFVSFFYERVPHGIPPLWMQNHEALREATGKLGIVGAYLLATVQHFVRIALQLEKVVEAVEKNEAAKELYGDGFKRFHEIARNEQASADKSTEKNIPFGQLCFVITPASSLDKKAVQGRINQKGAELQKLLECLQSENPHGNMVLAISRTLEQSPGFEALESGLKESCGLDIGWTIKQDSQPSRFNVNHFDKSRFAIQITDKEILISEKSAKKRHLELLCPYSYMFYLKEAILLAEWLALDPGIRGSIALRGNALGNLSWRALEARVDYPTAIMGKYKQVKQRTILTKYKQVKESQSGSGSFFSNLKRKSIVSSADDERPRKKKRM